MVLADCCKSGRCGGLFRRFAFCRGSASEQASIDQNFHLIHGIVRRTADSHRPVFGRFPVPSLGVFLKRSLRIHGAQKFRWFLAVFLKNPEEKGRDALCSLIEINCSAESFECIGKGGIAIASMRVGFPASEENVVAERYGAGELCKRILIHQRGADFRQVALLKTGVTVKKMFRQNDLNNGVSQKFQPLIIRQLIQPLLIGE